MNQTVQDRPPADASHPDTGPTVEIQIDNRTFMIHRGRNEVSEIKAIGNVPAAYELDQVIDGKLTHLPDDSSVTIKGGEKFLSHPRDNCAS